MLAPRLRTVLGQRILALTESVLLDDTALAAIMVSASSRHFGALNLLRR
jgi:hypothetical protein